MSNGEVNVANARTEVMEMQPTRGGWEPPPPYSPPTAESNPQIVYQTVIVQTQLKNRPTLFTCPNCHKREVTKVKYVNSHGTHMISGFICGFTL